MKKINTLVLSTLTAALLIGCGGGSSSGGTTTGTTTGTTNENIVTAERGAIFDAKVTDASGQLAVQLDKTKNEYTFESKIVFPVTVTGGFIDMDNDLTTTDDVIDFEGQALTSYSNNITPITNYLGNPADTAEYSVKLQTLKTVLERNDITEEELKSLPSKLAKTDIFALTNTIYLATKDNDATNDDFTSEKFKDIFTGLKESVTSTDPKIIAKQLETKVMVTELNKTILTETELKQRVENLGMASDKLKIADLGRFVSYDGADDWFDDNTLSNGKITFKPYNNKWNFAINDYEWTLDEGVGYVSVTTDATNPHKFSYVDSITKEEGTFTIISTTKLGNYTDLSKSIAQIEVTKAGTELEWDRWDWANPYYFTQTGTVQIVDINTLVDSFGSNYSSSLNFNEKQVYLNSDGKIVDSILSGPHYEKGTTEVGTWKKEADQIVATVGKQTKYLKVVSEDGKYYIEEAEINSVGYIDNEVIYTGSSLDDLIANIKAPYPVITSDYSTVADENQTGLFFSTNGTEAFKATVENNQSVTFSLSGTDGKYFNINSDGVVTFKTAPDFETKRYYSFDLVATTKVGKEYSKNIQVKINNLEETTTPIEPTTPTITSFVSGKVAIVSDADGQTTATFNENGTYSESYGDGTCTGKWKDLGSNKIGVTCEDAGTSATPDSVASQTTNILQFTSSTPAVNDTVTVTEPGMDPYNMTIISINNISSSSSTTTPTNLVWESWDEQNPMMDGEPIITLDMLIASFTNTSYSNWFAAMDNNGNDIEATLSSNGNVVNVSGHEQYGGALHGSTVLGSWDRSNNMINITMDTGEKIHIRLGTSGVNYVVQVAYE